MLLSVPAIERDEFVYNHTAPLQVPGQQCAVPLYSAVPAWRPDACSVSSSLSQNGRISGTGADTSPSQIVQTVSRRQRLRIFRS